jgi:Uma2 family endonuclease
MVHMSEVVDCMGMQVHRRALVSEAEFLALPETTGKTELLDGEVIVSPSPSFWHQEVLGRLIVALRQWAHGRAVTVGQAPLDVRFERNRILQPDAFVILESIPPDHQGPIDRVPELCIEVVSDRVYDRVTKRLIYARSGVVEYWVVEQAGLVERFSGAELAVVEEIRDRLTTPLLDGFELDVATLFT